MAIVQENGVRAKTPRRKLASWVAGIAAGSLVAGSLVFAGIGAQIALAAGTAPDVTTSTPGSYIWGEDLPIDMNFTGAKGAGAQFNVSAGVVLPEGATVVDNGTLGTPITYTAGEVLPGASAATEPNGACEALGLEAAPKPAGACQVPAGKQYLVFQNISDLPEGATAHHTLTVRPDAETYELGAQFPYQVNGYTNGNERFLPVFPGSTGVNTDDARKKSSSPGITAEDVEVNGLRIAKTEVQHAENEVLRGVHGDHGAVFELRIEHTGQSDLSNAIVVDYLPAGLEYLTSCGLETDNTTNANGTQRGKDEYPGSGPLNTKTVGENCLTESLIETVQGTLDAAGNFVEGSGEVFTRVTWEIGTWLKDHGGIKQEYAEGTAGVPAVTTIRYRAGVPLYENTMDFGVDVDVAVLGETGQGANLDNNRGAPTRHGTEDLTANGSLSGGGTDGADANSYTNAAVASGAHGDTALSDADAETIDAVDVRLLKTVNGEEAGVVGGFEQGNTVRYGLNLATSEYVSAVQGDPSQRPLRIVDDMADGLCPVFGPGTKLWQNAAGDHPQPNLILGGYNPYEPGTKRATVQEWNDALVAAGVDKACQWDARGHSQGALDSEKMTGGQLVGIAFSPKTGRFFLELAMENDDALNAPDRALTIEYGVHQNSTYIKGSERPDGDEGATSSRDLFENTAEINLRTTPIEAVFGVGTPGMSPQEQERLDAPWNSWDDSDAWVQAGTTDLTKKVLERGEVPTRENVGKSETDGGPASDRWVDAAETPFAAGDETWYRIEIDPPNGADVRNPVFTDFLPEGVSFNDQLNAEKRHENILVLPRNGGGFPGLGTCEAKSQLDWVNIFAPVDGIKLNGNVLSFVLGATGEDCGVGGKDRFLPFEATLEIYIKVTVTDPSAFAAVDLPQNLAKYQQENDEGEIFFLRDDATIVSDRTPQLLKGVASVKQGNDESSTLPAQSESSGDGDNFNSNRDGIEVLQGDEVTYRLDVTAPYTTTDEYLVWDVLPEGIRAADVNTGSYTAQLVEAGDEVADATVTAKVYDYPYTGAPAEIEAQLKDQYQKAERSIIVWSVTSEIPASTREVTDAAGVVTTEAVERGLTLGYTVTVPAGTDAGGALAAQNYKNDASIVEFNTVNNDGGQSTVIVDGTENVADPRETNGTEPVFVFKDIANDTSDPSDVFLPTPEMAKTLMATEVGPNDLPNLPAGENNIDPNNLDSVIVQGELATYDISVTIPAHTTVRNGVLADNGTLVRRSGGTMTPKTADYQLASSKVTQANGHSVDIVEKDEAADRSKFSFNENTGKLIFPEYYQNDSDAAQIFTVRLVLWMQDVDASNPKTSDKPVVPNSARPEIGNNALLRNTATFKSDSVQNKDGKPVANEPLSKSADVTYREPNLAIEKTAVSSGEGGINDVNSGDIVTYSLTVLNTRDRVKSYDNTVVDTVPAGLLIQADSFKVDGTPIPDSDLTIEAGVFKGTGGTIKWASSDIEKLEEIPETVVLSYTAKISEDTGAGSTFKNDAAVTGYTLPSMIDGKTTADRRGDRVAKSDATITATTAAIDKVVRIKGDTDYTETVSAPIGETVQYKVDVTLHPDINYYDIEVRDALSAGVELQKDTVKVEMTTGSGRPADVTSAWTRSGKDPSHTWVYNQDGGDLTSSSEQRVLTFTYDVLLKNTVAYGVNSLPNTAGVTWATTDGGKLRDPLTDPAGVTVLNPLLSIVKDVKHAEAADSTYADAKTGEVDQKFTYRLNVTNANGATRSDAYNTTVTDKIPAGVVVEESTFKINGTAVTSPNAVSKSGDTITWTYPGAIAPGATVSLTYDATFANSETLNTDALVNTGKVTHYESFPSGGREYNPTDVQDTASVTPLFPMVDPMKSVTTPVAGEDYGLAYVDTPFGWTLTFTNNGTGAATSADVVDTLPANWSYVAGSAKVNNQPLGKPEEGSDGGNTTLTWTTAQLKEAIDDLFPLAAGDVFVITFSAQPDIDAIDTPGTGLPVGGAEGKAHINTVKVTNVTDTQGKDRNKVGDYSGDDDSAKAYIAEADLLLEKAAIGGTSADIELSNGDTLDAGSWIPGATAGQLIDGTVDYTQPQWQLTVNNHGPDASFGEFTVSEKQTLPEGVTATNWQAQYFAAGSTTGTPLPLEVTGSGANLSLTVGDATTSLNAKGTDRIVITANVNIPAGTTATDEQLKNIAYVEGETFERDANKNPDKKPKNPNEAEAGKELTSVADLVIVKTFAQVEGDRNAGDLINWTITVTNNGPDHSLSTSGDGNQIVVVDDVPVEIVDPAVVTGSLPAGWSVAQDGQRFTFTLTPEARLDRGASVSFSFSGRIGGDVEAGTPILNTATVTPGETPDPYTPNNEDEDTTNPVTAHTSVSASKQRVVFDTDADVWVPTTGEATAGDQVSYRLQLTNTGSYVPARGVTLTDELPSYLTLSKWVKEMPATDDWKLDQTGQKLVFTNAEAVVAPGETASVIVTATVAADHREDVVNTVCVATGNLDPAQSTLDDCATDTTGSDKSVDWELLKSHVTPAADAPVKAGEVVRYRLELNNNGPSVSDGPITITDVLPAGFSYAGNVAATGATLSEAAVDGQTVTWTAEGLSADRSFAVGAGVVTVEFDALVAANVVAGDYENTARVDGPAEEPDTNPGNNDDEDIVPVIRDAQMHIDKQVQSIDGNWGETAEHASGTTVTWGVKITNSGPSAAPVTFTDDLALAPGVTLVTVDGGSDWQWNEATQSLKYVANDGLFPVTAADESNAAWITITTSLAAGVPPTEAPGLVNWGKIVWVDNTTNPDLPDGGNSASDDANITTVRNADLGLVKHVLASAPKGDWIDADSADSAGAAVAGQSTSYRVLVSNNGPSDAVAPLTVHDLLPQGATFVKLVDSPEWSASYDEASHTVTFGRDAKFGGLLNGAAPLAIEYEVSFDSSLAAGSVLENTASLGDETLETNGDTYPDNNTNPANLVVERQIDLGIMKSHDADTVRIGDALPFKIDVTNHGPSEASGVIVTDTVPAGLAVLSEVGPVLDAEGVETGWTIETITLAQPGDDTVDPAIPADAAAGATVTASYAHPLAPGDAAAPLVINTLVTASAYETVINVVDVTANEPEPDPDTENPNHAEDPVTVPPMVTLITEKTAIGDFQVGKNGIFEITVENQGPTADPGPITVLDALPRGLTYRSSPNLPAGVTVDVRGQDVTWTITDGLAVGEKVSLTLEVLVSQRAYPEVTNTVVVDSPAEKTPESVLEDSATVKVKAADALAITGGDMAAFTMLAALLLLLGGGALALRAQRKRQGALKA